MEKNKKLYFLFANKLEIAQANNNQGLVKSHN